MFAHISAWACVDHRHPSEGSMDKGKPCESCNDYDRDKNQCRILRELQGLSLDELDAPDKRDVKLCRRGELLSNLFHERPCKFARFITDFARKTLEKRNLISQHGEDIFHSVFLSLQ